MDSAEQDLNSRDSTRVLVLEDSGDTREELTDDEHTAGSSSHKNATFSTLPTDLRLIIWNLARPGPRIVRIRKSNRSPVTYSRAAIPNLLHVCQESRQVALEWYQLSFGASRTLYSLASSTSVDGIYNAVVVPSEYQNPRTYFDFSRDILFAGCEECDNSFLVDCICCSDFIRRFDKHKVQKLLVHYEQSSKLEQRSPFGVISDKYREAKEIMIFSPLTKMSESEIQWNRLREILVPLPWQRDGQSLMDGYVDEGERSAHAACYVWKAERVTRVDFSDPDSATPVCEESH